MQGEQVSETHEKRKWWSRKETTDKRERKKNDQKKPLENQKQKVSHFFATMATL